MPVQFPHIAFPLVCVLMIASPSLADEPEAGRDVQSNVSEETPLAEWLVGSWRIVDAHRDGEPSKIHFGIVTIKHITPTQFQWLSYKPDDRKIFRSMGGSWKVVDGMYVETPLYGMEDNFVESKLNKSLPIQCELDGDIFTQTIALGGGSKFVEIWQRIKPGEDPAAAVKKERDE